LPREEGRKILPHVRVPHDGNSSIPVLFVNLPFFSYYFLLLPGLWYNIISLIFGYSLGSFPTAYLLVKWIAHLDIRRAGTGNVGTMNVLEVTKSTPLGVSVLIVDIAKGAAAVWLGSLLPGESYWNPAAAGIGCILGHNYSPWIGFKGGRGLAPGAGVLLVMGWVLVAVWCLLWAIAYRVVKNIHSANIVATLASLLGGALLPGDLIRPLVRAPGGSIQHSIFYGILCVLILSRHAEYLSNLWKTMKKPV
jgi:glycerol-3-phosphate acyltransferase PlsY